MSKRKSVSQATMDDRNAAVDEASSDIAPALSEHEWTVWRGQRINPVTMLREVSGFAPNADNLWKTIAITNDQLHDDDPRKFTRRWPQLLRQAAAAVGIAQAAETDDWQKNALGELYSELHESADVIASLLIGEK
jgi:hypothetical protein